MDKEAEMNTEINIDLLEQNTGQIKGLPKNPRDWSKGDVKKLAKSIQDTPELLDARGLIVIKNNDKYVILGGNMRYEACKQAGITEIPCYVLKEGTSVRKLKEIVIKDNGSFGKWDWDMLANEWDERLLIDSNVISWGPEADAQREVKTVGEVEFGVDESMILRISVDAGEYDTIIDALSKVDSNKEKALLKVLGL